MKLQFPEMPDDFPTAGYVILLAIVVIAIMQFVLAAIA